MNGNHLNGNSLADDVNSKFLLARRSTYLKVNLDILLNNLQIIRSRISDHTEIIAMVKGNAHGHGSVAVSKFLETHGIRHFAVATVCEGEELRQSGIRGYIFVFGTASAECIPTLFENDLIPVVATVEFVNDLADYLHEKLAHETYRGSVIIKIDTGMSRNGCMPEHLADIVKACDSNGVHIHSMMTHFSQSWDDLDFTKQQLETFMRVVKPYRERGIKLHVSNSGALHHRIGTDLDFVRPGITLVGIPEGLSDELISDWESTGYRSCLYWIARPTLVKRLHPGAVVGYSQTYMCKEAETIAVFQLGYADGYPRKLFKQGYLTTPSGIKCPVVGKVSMDSLTVKIPDGVTDYSIFYLVSSDPINTPRAIAEMCGMTVNEFCTGLRRRLPRLCETDGKTVRETDV